MQFCTHYRLKKRALPPLDKPKIHVTVSIPDDPLESKYNPHVSFIEPVTKDMAPVEKPDMGGPGNV